VSSDRLIEELWGDAPPGNPANALQAQVSALRRVLGTDAVARDGAGYRLALAPDEVDTARFERLAHAGRDAATVGKHDAAADAYREAAALVTGPPLEGLLDFPFARDAAPRLEQLSITVHEGFVDAELAQGHHADVVHTLTELVAAHPLWERFHAQLILALYRCGRQSDALRAYQHVRTLLADEMGLDPGPELRALERAVLSHDPALAAPVPVAPFHPAVTAPVPLTAFIGRATDLAALTDAHGTSRLVTVVGPGGAGKTRLVLALTESFALHVEWWFVDLSAVVDERAVADAVATPIGA
jgi:DNA-binding SARP family transcriptional activator